MRWLERMTRRVLSVWRLVARGAARVVVADRAARRRVVNCIFGFCYVVVGGSWIESKQGNRKEIGNKEKGKIKGNWKSWCCD